MIANSQGDVFSDNAYSGPWSFLYFNQGDIATWSQWTPGLTNVEGSGDTFGAQDVGSTFNASDVPARNDCHAHANPYASVRTHRVIGDHDLGQVNVFDLSILLSSVHRATGAVEAARSVREDTVQVAGGLEGQIMSVT